MQSTILSFFFYIFSQNRRKNFFPSPCIHGWAGKQITWFHPSHMDPIGSNWSLYLMNGGYLSILSLTTENLQIQILCQTWLWTHYFSRILFSGKPLKENCSSCFFKLFLQSKSYLALRVKRDNALGFLEKNTLCFPKAPLLQFISTQFIDTRQCY